MADKYQEKYRITSSRLKYWDYGWPAAYFITICTRNREKYFGDVHKGRIILSEIGLVAENEWENTPQVRIDMNIKLGEYIIMPNHIHGIINIGENIYNAFDKNKTEKPTTASRRDAMHCVSTNNSQINLFNGLNKFGPQTKNLASIVRGYKSVVTLKARLIYPNFAWQARFYEHILRNEDDLNNVSEYMMNNPLQWELDELYK